MDSEEQNEGDKEKMDMECDDHGRHEQSLVSMLEPKPGPQAYSHTPAPFAVSLLGLAPIPGGQEVKLVMPTMGFSPSKPKRFPLSQIRDPCGIFFLRLQVLRTSPTPILPRKGKGGSQL